MGVILAGTRRFYTINSFQKDWWRDCNDSGSAAFEYLFDTALTERRWSEHAGLGKRIPNGRLWARADGALELVHDGGVSADGIPV